MAEEELTDLSSKVRFEAAVRELVRDDQIAFISRGEKGSAAYVNGKFIYADTIKVEPIDTTGAGDAFYSYILYELDKNRSILKKEEKIIEMLIRANAVGAIATLKKGATGVVPTIDELDRYLEENM